ncbi:MAG: C4-dicarboxylate ABC transporter [Dokdonella sp.]|nr:MAG: C4-dicarboxylate ABC transporter [Dokdonella sp.]
MRRALAASGVVGWWRHRARRVAPGAFALVMATGIVAIDAHQHGLPRIARLLFATSLAAHALLLALQLLRLHWFRAQVCADLGDARRGAGFLTFSAGSCVLASQCLLLVRWPTLAWTFTLTALLAWLVLLPRFAATLAQAARRPRFAHSIGGGWLIVVVATQGLAIAATLLAAQAPDLRVLLLPAALGLFVLGSVSYPPLIALVGWRLACRPLQPRQFTAPYWITMGALAISTLAGSLLVRQGPPATLLPPWHGLLVLATVVAWVAACAWLPLLLALWLWRWRHAGLRHAREDWNIVFPLGMYTVGSFELARALDLAWLRVVPAVGVYVSLLAWMLVAGGALHARWRVLHRWRRRRGLPAPVASHSG